MYHVHPASGVKSFARTIGTLVDSCEYNGGKVFLSSWGSKSINDSFL
jgi:hypothetical protein